jgi:hypothetical protein
MSTAALAFAPSPLALNSLAHRVAEFGVDVDRATVVQVVREATATGASHVLADVVTDPREPEVARQRALGALLAHLSMHRNRPAPPADPDPRDTLSTWPVHAC